ncbi:Gfo/Idh/MocA family protein, partial [Verrucomicrobiota bacterium]
YRFTPESQALKKETETGILGDIYFAKTIWLRRLGIPGRASFLQLATAGGGPLIDLGVHRLDLALWLMGYPKPVWVLAGAYNHLGREWAKDKGLPYEVEDLAAGFIRFENGATLEVEASWAGHINERELMETRLLGTKGGLVQRNLNQGYEFEAELFYTQDGVHYDLRPHPPLPPVGSAMAHFVDCIRDDTPHTATGEEGLTVMALLDAIYESARKGEPVKIGAAGV